MRPTPLSKTTRKRPQKNNNPPMIITDRITYDSATGKDYTYNIDKMSCPKSDYYFVVFFLQSTVL
jgi:hypothetical protein